MEGLTLEKVFEEVSRVGGNVTELTNHMTTMARKLYKEDEPVADEPKAEADDKGTDWEKMFKSESIARFLKSTSKGRKFLKHLDELGGDEMMGEFPPEQEPEIKGSYARYAEGPPEGEGLPPIDEGLGEDPLGMPPEDGMMPYENEDEEVMMAMKLVRMMRTNKGFANAAKKTTNEEDTPFGDKDSTVPGNESSPAGRQGGNREDEAFGPGGMAYSAMLKQAGISETVGKQLAEILNTAQGGVEIAKGVIPDGTSDARGGKIGGELITREMQEEAKGRSYRDINRLRMEVGDLPRTLF